VCEGETAGKSSAAAGTWRVDAGVESLEALEAVEAVEAVEFTKLCGPHCPFASPFSNLTHTADSCGYQKAGTGICNSTVFGYPMDGFANILADVPTSYKTTTTDLITSDTFIDANYNHGMSRAGSLLIFVSARGARARQELVTVTSSCFPRLSSLPS
jgi:hypothetical protein